MSSITITDIKNSLQIPAFIKDPIIKNGIFNKTGMGDFVMYSGGFTAVFPVTVQNMKWAFRCWHADLGNMRRRMELLSKELSTSPLPYFCKFAYENEGILVNGKIYPTTRMEWIKGETIKDYICSHPTTQELKELADKFLKMCQDLHQYGYAHGDLQHGNIMVDSDKNLRLIDYDSMYVSSMLGFNDIISGLQDYQHPKRKENQLASPKLDYFSELVIYISLLAIAENPSLIEEYNLEDADRLLFTINDYRDLQHSSIYTKLMNMQQNFPLLLHIMEEYLQKDDINDLEPFDVLINRYTIVPVIKMFEVENGKIQYKDSLIRLQWEVENYTSLHLNGVLLQQSNSTYSEKLHTDKTYRLEATNGLHHISTEIKIKIVEKPDISIKLSPHKLKKNKTGEKSILRWDIRHATQIKLFANKREEGDIKNKGEKVIAPTETTVYSFNVTGLDGKTVFEKQITLYVLSESTILFKADKLFTFPNVPVLLTWKTEHAKTVELVEYGNVSKCGKQIVEIDKDTTFELKVMDNFGIQTKRISIKILPLPVIKSIMVPTPQLSKKVTISNQMPSMQTSIPMLQQIAPPIDASKLAMPSFEGLKINMKEMPSFIPTPQFHLLQLDIKRSAWWQFLENKFYKLNKIVKRLI